MVHCYSPDVLKARRQRAIDRKFLVPKGSLKSHVQVHQHKIPLPVPCPASPSRPLVAGAWKDFGDSDDPWALSAFKLKSRVPFVASPRVGFIASPPCAAVRNDAPPASLGDDSVAHLNPGAQEFFPAKTEQVVASAAEHAWRDLALAQQSTIAVLTDHIASLVVPPNAFLDTAGLNVCKTKELRSDITDISKEIASLQTLVASADGALSAKINVVSKHFTEVQKETVADVVDLVLDKITPVLAKLTKEKYPCVPPDVGRVSVHTEAKADIKKEVSPIANGAVSLPADPVVEADAEAAALEETIAEGTDQKTRADDLPSVEAVLAASLKEDPKSKVSQKAEPTTPDTAGLMSTNKFDGDVIDGDGHADLKAAHNTAVLKLR